MTTFRLPSAVALALFVTVSSVRPARAAEVTVRGWGFEVAKLEDGARAFLNRDYVWRELPEQMRDWQFTRLGGGVRTQLTAFVDQDGPVYLVTGATQEGIDLEGWRRVPEWSFHYSTKHKTPMAVYVRDGRSGEPVEIPQGNWTGGIVVGPKLKAQLVQPKPDHSKVPGVIIDYAPAAWGRYIGCPSIAVLADGTFGGWLEGNAVVTREGRIVNILRVDCPPGGKGAVIQISDDGTVASFDPADGLVDLPGGAKKFSIRFDPVSKQYWSLTNWIPKKERSGRGAGSVRNTLALVCSPDLKEWTVRSVLLYNPDQSKHGFQYVDWLFDGPDIIAVSRTAFDDGIGGAHNFHDANYFTFHRIADFRDRQMDDPPLD